MEIILEVMLKEDKSLSATTVFSHLLAMLAKDLGEELFPSFTTIWTALNSILSLPTINNSETVEAIIACQMFYLRIYIQQLLSDVHNFGRFFITELVKSANNLRKTACNTLAYFFKRAPPNELKALLASLVPFDKKLLGFLTETLLIIMRDFETHTLDLAFVSEELAKNVCIRALLFPEIDLESFWKGLIASNHSTDILASCLALRKGGRVRLQREIICSRLHSLDGSTDTALFLALLLKSCNVSALLSLRGYLQNEQFLKVDRQALDLFLQALSFDLWQILDNCLISVRNKESFSEFDSSIEGRVIKFLDQPNCDSCEYFVAKLNPVALSSPYPLPLDYLHLCLASHDPVIVQQSLSKFSGFISHHFKTYYNLFCSNRFGTISGKDYPSEFP